MPDGELNKPFTPETLQSMSFRIPLYQRPYAWEDIQVERLLNDLHDACRNGDRYYHVGILSVAKTDDGRFDLIDGQQRMTTLMLVGKAAKQYFPEWNRFLSRSRLDLYGREHDKAFLDSEDNLNPAPECNRRMRIAVGVTEAFFDKQCDTPEARAKLAGFIYKSAAVFLSEVPSDYSVLDKNQQFVRMNNRGKQLENHEILKVTLLSGLPQEAQAEAFEIWNKMTDCLTGKRGDYFSATSRLVDILRTDDKDKGNSGEGGTADGKERFSSAIVTVPEFLLIALSRFRKRPSSTKFDVLKLMPEEISQADKLLQFFAPLGRDPGAISEFVSFLADQLEIFRSFFIFADAAGKYNLPIEKEESPDSAFAGGRKEGLIAVQSFLNVSTEPHHWLIPALEWLESWRGEHPGQKLDAELFLNTLESIDNDLIPGSCVGLSGGEGKRVLSPITAISGMEYGKISRYWFYRLDYELWKLWKKDQSAGQSPDSIWRNLHTIKDKDDVKRLLGEFSFRRCGSIEHMYPQRPMEREAEVDSSFGNLALISAARNSKFSNNGLEGKKEIIRNSGYTESLKMLHFLWCSRHDTAVEGQNMFAIVSKAVTEGKTGAPIPSTAGNDIQ